MIHAVQSLGRAVIHITTMTTTTTTSQEQEQQQQQTNNNSTTSDNDNNSKGGWNKPIFIESLVVRASELCPPMSLKDQNNMPAIYQTIDKMVEVIWRRLLAEMAKSNAGRLFNAAMGEVLSVMKRTMPAINNSKKKSNTTTTTEPKEIRV